MTDELYLKDSVILQAMYMAGFAHSDLKSAPVALEFHRGLGPCYSLLDVGDGLLIGKAVDGYSHKILGKVAST